MLEAVNENRADCFGWALEEAVEDGLPDLRPEHDCHHSHFEKSTLVGTRHADSTDSSQENKTGRRNDRKWQWWPSWYELRTHYFREIGFLACLSQMVGASVFWISGLTGLPPIYNALSAPALDGIYWLPQVSVLSLSLTFCLCWHLLRTRSLVDAGSSFRVGCLCSKPSRNGTSPDWIFSAGI